MMHIFIIICCCLVDDGYYASQELLANHPLSDILWSLCDVAKEAERQLQSHTSGINLKQDTRQLRSCIISSF